MRLPDFILQSAVTLLIVGFLEADWCSPLMPRNEDFSESDTFHCTESYRARHTAHLAAMCCLIGQQLSAARFATEKKVPTS